MGTMEEIKMVKNLFFLMFVFLGLSSGVFGANQECFDKLMDKNPGLDVNFVDYQRGVDASDFYVHPKPWDSLDFSEDVVFLKFYGFGEKTVFVYDNSEFEKIKFGSLNWPANSEYMFFEMYVSAPGSSEKGFAGCGYINTVAKAPYTSKTITGDKYLGCPGDESFQEYESDGEWIFKRLLNNCYDYDGNNFVGFNIDRVFVNDESLYVNMYEVTKNHAQLKERFLNSEDFDGFSNSYYPKLANYDKPFVDYLKKGLVPLKWEFGPYANVEYYPLKQNIDLLKSPRFVASVDGQVEGFDIMSTYRGKVFLTLKKDEFFRMLDEIIVLDNSFDIEEYRMMGVECENLENEDCIGLALTEKLLESSRDVYAVNFFVDTVLSAENEYYILDDSEKIDELIGKKKLIFGKSGNEGFSEDSFDDDSGSDTTYMNTNGGKIMLYISHGLIFVVIVLTVLFKRKK